MYKLLFKFTIQRYEQKNVIDVVRVIEKIDKKLMMCKKMKNEKMKKRIVSNLNIFKFVNFSQMKINVVLLTSIFLRINYQKFEKNTTSSYK